MSIDYQLNDDDWETQNVPGEKCIPVPLCRPEIPCGLDWNWTQASTVKAGWLTAWAVTWRLQFMISVWWELCYR